MYVRQTIGAPSTWLLLIKFFFFLQYFLNPKLAKEPVPPQLELIAKEIIVPMLTIFHCFVEKVVLISVHFHVLPISTYHFFINLHSNGCYGVKQVLANNYSAELDTEKFLLIVCKCIFFSVSSILFFFKSDLIILQYRFNCIDVYSFCHISSVSNISGMYILYGQPRCLRLVFPHYI